MIILLELANTHYQIETNNHYSIAIPIAFNQSEQQPNHFSAVQASARPMQASGFIGDTKQGGSCNVNELTINPHCNGTHTETIAHICHSDDQYAEKIHQISLPPLMPCALISIEPKAASTCSDSYLPNFNSNDQIINRASLEAKLEHYQDNQLQCLVIRTLPNEPTKQQQSYHQDNQPAFFSREAIAYLNERKVEHLLVDIPSIDRLHDDGLLTCHHLFWQVKAGEHHGNSKSLMSKTITEMAYIDNKIDDGFYFMNLQLPAFINDAAPSRPVLYKIKLLSD